MENNQRTRSFYFKGPTVTVETKRGMFIGSPTEGLFACVVTADEIASQLKGEFDPQQEFFDGLKTNVAADDPPKGATP